MKKLYSLYQWPDSQCYVSDDSAILVVNDEDKEEHYGPLDSSYMVPDKDGSFELTENVSPEVMDKPTTLMGYEGEVFVPVENNDEITAEFLLHYGFKLDESAPVGVVRYHKLVKGCISYYVWVRFNETCAYQMFVRKTVYSPNGAVVDTTTFYKEETITLDMFKDANKKLNINILD